MSLWAEYIKEREDRDVIETTDGFVAFKVRDEFVHLEDLYVRPEKRLSGAGTALADAVAARGVEAGCRLMITSVCPAARGSTESMKAVLAYGFRLSSCDGKLVWFVKELENGKRS